MAILEPAFEVKVPDGLHPVVDHPLFGHPGGEVAQGDEDLYRLMAAAFQAGVPQAPLLNPV